jgi:4-amino-4-deoxy-L-arabinose transferase-like glycosyltransferase
MTHASALGRRATGALVIMGGACLAGAMIVRARSVIALVTMSVAGIGFLIVLVRACDSDDGRHDDDKHRLLTWTLAAFAAHLFFSLAVSSTSASLRFFGGDATTYHQTASQLVTHWNGLGAMPKLPSGKEGFYYLLGGLYWLFGAHQTAGLAMNAAFSAALIPVVTDSTRRLYGAASARYVAPLLLLLPGLFVWTSQLLKEAPILFFIALAVNCVVRLTDRLTIGRMVLFAVAVALLLSFRGHVGFFVAAGLFGGVILGRRQLVSGAAAGVVVLLMLGVVVLAGGVGESGYQTVTTASFTQANNTRQGLAAGAGSSFGEGVDISTSSHALSYLPVGLVNFFLGPFPWEVAGARQVVALPDTLVWWWLLPSLWAGYGASRRLMGRRTLLLILPALITSVILALVISNFGTVVREREQIVVVLAPLIALGLATKAADREARSAAAAALMPGVNAAL